MPYGRRRFRRRVRRVRRRPSSARRRYRTFRKTYRKFRKTVTGIGPRKTLKVRKEFTWNINPEAAGAGVSYNQLMVGCAQSANLNGWVKYAGNAITGIGDTLIDPNGSTGIRQWFSFYERYVVHASKIKVELYCPTPQMEETRGLAVTLVPTVGHHLAINPGGALPFDQAMVDPAELPYARKVLLPSGGEPNNASTRKLSSYISVKKMLNVKDINDCVTTVSPVTGTINSGFIEPFVPAITTATMTALLTQPQNGLGTVNGIYWNLVFQEIGKNQDPAPANPFHAGVSMRIIQTSYIQFSDRLPLATA